MYKVEYYFYDPSQNNRDFQYIREYIHNIPDVVPANFQHSLNHLHKMTIRYHSGYMSIHVMYEPDKLYIYKFLISDSAIDAFQTFAKFWDEFEIAYDMTHMSMFV